MPLTMSALMYVQYLFLAPGELIQVVVTAVDADSLSQNPSSDDERAHSSAAGEGPTAGDNIEGMYIFCAISFIARMSLMILYTRVNH